MRAVSLVTPGLNAALNLNAMAKGRKPITNQEAGRIARIFAGAMLAQTEVALAFDGLPQADINKIGRQVQALAKIVAGNNKPILGSTDQIVSIVLADRKEA